MIISCEKCAKKFNVDDNLIPHDGRNLQCSSCGYKWFFKKKSNVEKNKEKTVKKQIEIKKLNPNEQVPPVIDSIIKEAEEMDVKNLGDVIQKNNKISILNLFFLFLITFVAFIILLDTFKIQIDNLIPGFNILLDNFYESITDFYLFSKDLIR
tara:strand:- start:456 stop:914 length:459 start_codon:yes stop_codon:yes gene_type:complete